MNDLEPAQREILDQRVEKSRPRNHRYVAGAHQHAGTGVFRDFIAEELQMLSDDDDISDDNNNEEEDVVHELFEPRMARLWQRRFETEQRMAQQQEEVEYVVDNCCPICHVVSLASPPASVKTFLQRMLVYDQENCLRMSDEHICKLVIHTFNNVFLPRYSASDATVRQLPRWKAADYYSHFISPTAHDNTNVLRHLLRLHGQTQCNLEDLNHMLWTVNAQCDDEQDTNSRRLSIEAQKQFINTAKLQLTITNTLHQTRQKLQSAEQGNSDEVVALGYNIADDKRYRGRVVNNLL